MNTFGLKALVEGYSFAVGNNVRMQQLEGGMPRKVIKFVGAIHNVTATVLLDGDMARQYFWAFFYQNETKEFKWTLATDDGGVQECICQFNNDQIPSLQIVGGYVWKATVNIFVKPVRRNKDFDESLVSLWNGTTLDGRFEIEKIPNVYFPDATGVDNGNN